MKKLITLLIALAMLLSSCADNSKEPDTKAAPAAKEEKLTFTEMLVLDNDSCMIKITGVSMNDTYGCKIYTEIENKSCYEASVLIEHPSINGVSCAGRSILEIGTETITDTIDLNDTVLKENDIGLYSDIELNFCVVFSDNTGAIINEENESVHIYPYGEEKAARYVRASQETDQVLFDNEYVTVIATGYEYRDNGDFRIHLSVENKTTELMEISARLASINGIDISAPKGLRDGDAIGAAQLRFGYLYWESDALEKAGISTFDEISMTLCVTDCNEYEPYTYVEQDITLNP